MSECWEFYAILTARVIFVVKKVWTYSVLDKNKFGLFKSSMIEMRYLFVAEVLNALFIDTGPTRYLCFVVPTSSLVPCKQGPLQFLKKFLFHLGCVEPSGKSLLFALIFPVLTAISHGLI